MKDHRGLVGGGCSFCERFFSKCERENTAQS